MHARLSPDPHDTSALHPRAIFDQFDSATESTSEAATVPKSQETKHLLATALNEHFLFNQLQESHLLMCIDRMVTRQYSVGEDIITQVCEHMHRVV